ESLFDGMLKFYERTLDLALRFRFITLLVFLGVLASTVGLFVMIPKGFFPNQDTGIIIGITDAAQDVSFGAMERLQKQVNDVVLQDPAVAGITSSVGAGSGGQTANNGRMYIQLKPFDQRSETARQVAQFFTGLKAYYVILEVTPNQQGMIDTLRQLYVKSSDGAMVPLSTFVHVDTKPVQPLVVNHQSQFPSVTISYNLKPGYALG